MYSHAAAASVCVCNAECRGYTAEVSLRGKGGVPCRARRLFGGHFKDFDFTLSEGF